MLYDKDEIYKQAQEIAKEDDTYFIEDITTLLPCSNSTFYTYFPDGSDELDTIKEILNKNKVSKKKSLRSKLAASDKAAEVLALYKLIGTDEERKKLSQGYVDITTQGDKIGDKINLNVNFKDFSDGQEASEND